MTEQGKLRSLYIFYNYLSNPFLQLKFVEFVGAKELLTNHFFIRASVPVPSSTSTRTASSNGSNIPVKSIASSANIPSLFRRFTRIKCLRPSRLECWFGDSLRRRSVVLDSVFPGHFLQFFGCSWFPSSPPKYLIIISDGIYMKLCIPSLLPRIWMITFWKFLLQLDSMSFKVS